MRILFLAVAALLAAPSAAQTGSAGPVEASPSQPIDPVRLALAQRAVDAVWPMGTYQRMMDGMFIQMMDAMVASMFTMKPGEAVLGLLPPDQVEKIDEAAGGRSMREIMLERDPYMEERMRIMNRVMKEEFVPIMNRLEPSIRQALARAYARKFSVAQLDEMNRFFATPAGKFYAAESTLISMDPELFAMMMSATPELTKQTPAMMKKMVAATAHLPPPKQTKPSEPAGKR